MAGLVPAIHAFPLRGDQGVDARDKQRRSSNGWRAPATFCAPQ
jgi:hypothetical protein